MTSSSCAKGRNTQAIKMHSILVHWIVSIEMPWLSGSLWIYLWIQKSLCLLIVSIALHILVREECRRLGVTNPGTQRRSTER